MTLLHNLAGLHCRENRYPQAEPLLRRSLAIQEKLLGRDHPEVGTNLAEYAEILRRTKREQEAIQIEIGANAILAQAP